MSSGRSSPPQDVGNNNASNVEPFYTNEDVAVLHDIIVLAQELLPNLPERERLPTNALFSAYYDILPRIGINADHDNRYARILFKIGGLRGDSMLYEKFEQILSKLGIEIEFDSGEQDLDSQHENAQTDLEDTEAVAAPQDENILPRGRARRNSESSAWDIGNSHSHPRQRRNSYSSLNKAQAELLPIQDRQTFLREALLQQKVPNQTTELPEIQRASNVGAWLNAKPLPHKERRRSISTNASFRIRRTSHSLVTGRPAPTTNTSGPTSDEYHAESEITAVTTAHDPDISDSLNILQEEIPNRPFGSLMQIKAEVILQHHLSFLAKHQLRAWRDKALQLQEDNVNLDVIALHHDRNALLNLALETWHNRYLERRSIAETERFFAHLERRSGRARDLYLLLKAFTHWHGYACEEAERTQAVRRHILRARMFNAWRDITAINDLKVRRQVLKKFFTVWQRKHNIISDHNVAALQKYEGNLAELMFRQWVRKVWDVKTTTWWAEGVKQRTLRLWTIAARNFSEGHRTAEEERCLQLAWNSWRIWRVKTNEHARQAQQAITFRHACLCFGAIRKWRLETLVIPAKNILQTDVATRLLREAFGIWLHRSKLERQSSAIDRVRILREAWTNWRHKSRLQMMRVRVDNRILVEKIYKCLLATRVSTSKRVFNRRLLHKTIQHWAERAQESNYRRWDQALLAQQFSAQKTHQLLLGRWRASLESQQQLDVEAANFYASRLLQGLVSQWTIKAKHVRQLQQWSGDAQFYFFTSKNLKHWKASTEASRREKRKAAYAQVRRTTKMNLARQMLVGWRFKAQKILDMQAQAWDVSQNKNIIIAMDIFDRWRARTEELGETESIWWDRVLRKHFEVWRDRSNAFQDLKVEAIVNFQEWRQNRAVKKWKLVTLQLRGRSFQAAEVRETNAKRKFRKMFNYWHQKAVERRPVKRARFLQAGEPNQIAFTTRAEAWSELGDEPGNDDWAKGLDEPITAASVPGYLSTPSRRIERVAAVAARFSSTTPRAPLSTPFERQLRAQYSGGLLPSLRKGPGRSTLGLGGGFPDIKNRGTSDYRGTT